MSKSSFGENKADPYRARNQEKEVGMDWPHFAKANIKCPQVVSWLEPPGKAESRQTKIDLVDEYRCWNQGRQNDMGWVEEDVQEMSALEERGCSPMFPEE